MCGFRLFWPFHFSGRPALPSFIWHLTVHFSTRCTCKRFVSLVILTMLLEITAGMNRSHWSESLLNIKQFTKVGNIEERGLFSPHHIGVNILLWRLKSACLWCPDSMFVLINWILGLDSAGFMKIDLVLFVPLFPNSFTLMWTVFPLTQVCCNEQEQHLCFRE